ncbi:unnamed protein product, partial [Chrysoparadoxa australica]
ASLRTNHKGRRSLANPDGSSIDGAEASTQVLNEPFGSLNGKALFGYHDFDYSQGMMTMSRLGCDIVRGRSHMGRPHTAAFEDRGRMAENAWNGPRRPITEGGGRFGNGMGGRSTLVEKRRQGGLAQASNGDPGEDSKLKNRSGSGKPEDAANEAAAEMGVSGTYGMSLKMKAAQTLHELSMDKGGEMGLLSDGVLGALTKLMESGSTHIWGLVGATLANITTSPNACQELIKQGGHQLLSKIAVAGYGHLDEATESCIVLALCRLSCMPQLHQKLLTEFNAAQAICTPMQKPLPDMKMMCMTMVLNLVGCSGASDIFISKVDVFLVSLCSSIEEIAKIEKPDVQDFVCQALDILSEVPASMVRLADHGVLDTLPKLALINTRRPENLRRLSRCLRNLSRYQKSHSSLIRTAHAVDVLDQLIRHEALLENCCGTAALLSQSE